MEAIDSTKLPPEPDITGDGKGECIELNEYDEIQEDKESEDHFQDTTLTSQFIKHAMANIFNGIFIHS